MGAMGEDAGRFFAN